MASSKSTPNVNDPGFGDWVNSIVFAEESDYSGDEGDAVAPDFQSDHDSETEQEISDREDESREESSDGGSRSPSQKRKKKDIRMYTGKNKFQWSSETPKTNVRTKKHNIISHLPGINN